MTEKRRERKGGGARSKEPTHRKRREGWGTLKFIRWVALLAIQEHSQEWLCHNPASRAEAGRLQMRDWIGERNGRSWGPAIFVFVRGGRIIWCFCFWGRPFARWLAGSLHWEGLA